MILFRRTLQNLAGAGVVSVIAAVVYGGSAVAQGKLEAQFTASLAGVPLGKGSWSVDISEQRYQVSTSGAATGLLRMFGSGQGSFASQGTISDGRLVPATYSATITTPKWINRVRMAFVGGLLKKVIVDPQQPSDPERVPVSQAQRRGVIDPIAATIVPVPGHDDPVSPQACQHSLSVFDGKIRYDLRLAFKRLEKVKAEQGYEGPVVVCSVSITPIAGYVPGGSAIKYVKEQKDIEIWLAPIANTRMLVPFRISTPTPLGVGMMQATQFISIPQPPHASTTTSMKTR